MNTENYPNHQNEPEPLEAPERTDEAVGKSYETGVPATDNDAETDQPGRPRPSIWVGSLTDYNDGVLHGDWFDAAREPDDIHADIQRMLDASPTAARGLGVAEEWGIFDYEGFGQAQLYQHDRIEVVSRIARGIAEHGPAFAAWASVMDGAADTALDQFHDVYLGHYDSAEAYGDQLVDDLGYQELLDDAVPEQLRSYVQIDTAGLVRDMQLGGDIHLIPADGGGVWVFDDR